MKIGNIETKNNIFLSPMAGITDLPFRLLCKEHGAGLIYSEMISSKALLYGDKKTEMLSKIDDRERPVAVQIFGHDLEAIEYSIKYFQDKADIIDINMGCPAPKVTKNGDGSCLLKNPLLIRDIVNTAVKNSTIPITVKIRIGWDEKTINVLEVSKIIEEAGASAIAIHGRTTKQFYSGKADWSYIKEVKERIKTIPIIGNGDITDEISAKEKIDFSGVDGILIGRGAIGNPWIFERIDSYINKGIILEKVSNEEKLDVIKKHYDMEIELKGERIAINEMRKSIAYYIKGYNKAAEFRAKINTLNSREEIFNELDKFFKEL